MVYGRVFEGWPREIAEKIAQSVGDRRVKVMLVSDAPAAVSGMPVHTEEEIAKLLAEIDADAVGVGQVDDSREAIHTRQEGE